MVGALRPDRSGEHLSASVLGVSLYSAMGARVRQNGSYGQLNGQHAILLRSHILELTANADSPVYDFLTCLGL